MCAFSHLSESSLKLQEGIEKILMCKNRYHERKNNSELVILTESQRMEISEVRQISPQDLEFKKAHGQEIQGHINQNAYKSLDKNMVKKQ